MKRLFSLLLITALLLPVLGLAQMQTDATAKRGIKPTRGLAANPEIPGESMVTGLPVEGPYLPVLVNIDNVAGSFPQWGIAQADIIYEMPIHGLSLTRLMALFAYAHPEAVGPVRSGRVMHAEMREEWDAGWVYVGVQSKKGSDVNKVLRDLGARQKDVLLLLDGTSSRANPYFSDMKGRSGPHHKSVNLAQFAQTIASYEFPQRAFLFSDEAVTAGQPATKIKLQYGDSANSATNSDFTYNPATGLYSRYLNNAPYVDKDQPEQALTFSNFIVQWTQLRFNGAANAPMLTEVGEGNADIFMGGRYIAGYWVRESVTDRTVFYDEAGQEIRLQRGKTFINITTDRSTKVFYE